MSDENGRMDESLTARIEFALSQHGDDRDAHGLALLLREAREALEETKRRLRRSEGLRAAAMIDRDAARDAIEQALQADDCVNDVRIWDSAEAHDILAAAKRKFHGGSSPTE